MVCKKSIYILLVVFLFSLFSVCAVDFDADLVAVKNKITINGIAEFKVTIYNHDILGQNFKIKNKNYPSWDIRTKPIVNPIIVEVPAKSNKTIHLFIDPNGKYVADSGSHFVNMEIISESSGESIAKQARIGLVSSGDIITGYVPTVIISSDFPSSINPNEELFFKINLVNQNNLNMSGAKLTLSSSLINEEIDLNILPKEDKAVEIRKKLDPKTLPAKDALTLRLYYKGKKVDDLIKNYEILLYSTIDDITTLKKSFLRSTENIVFTNRGNVKFEGQIRVTTSSVKRFFGSTRPAARILKEDGNYEYVWDVELEPFESYSVKITQNYLGVIILIVALLLIALLLFMKRSPLVLKKDIIETDHDEGGLSKVKVLINIKNRSGKKVKDIRIVDKIPKLLDMDRNNILGSLKPSKMKKNPKHETLILWDLEELTPGEERVITYHLKSNLKILGGLTLQPAMAKFMQNNKEVKTRSNRTFVVI